MSRENPRHRLFRAKAALPLALALGACSASGVREEAPTGAWRLAGAGADARGPTLEFLSDGRVAGHAGCNRYSSQAQWLPPDGLRFGPAAATKMACMDEAVMAQEVAFLQMLGRVAAWRREGSELVLLAADGTGLARLEPSPVSD
ncbi:MAG: META domain-containing protein [Xanthomonadales bacterium]|nr:META domain-containing protein [Xanthomonadales bacterium]